MTCYFLCAPLAALCLISCGPAEPQESATASPQAVPIVPVTIVTRSDLQNELVLTAEFKPFQEVEILSKVAGYVKQIRVDIGDHVRAGQLLAILEVPEMADEEAKAAAASDQGTAEIAAAQDDVQRAESAHQIAHLSFTRIDGVLRREPGLIPRQEVDEMQARDLVSEAQVAAAKSHLQAAQQHLRAARAEQARLKTLEQYTAITAPFSGIVTKRYANTGAMVQAGTSSQQQAMPVVRVAEINLLRLILPVPESAVPKVKIGAPVDVKVSSLNRVFLGRVSRFTGTVAESTRTMDTEVDVSNPSMTLLPGMLAEVNLTTERSPSALTLPLDAVERTGAASRVFEVTPTGIVRLRPVTVGLETAQGIEIKSGISEGNMVIIGRHAGIKDGDRVQPKAEANRG
ncbi:MAG: efflux RND transporter periplasmic adaptor subunit [Acidobacteriaceae bacterium]|nr:efflux RND transporter periplasmic adaptor subunit [Acidobacteriaceae bacterium]